MAYSIDIGGYTPGKVLQVQVQPPGTNQELSEATLTVGVSDSNLSNIEDGDAVTIDDNGNTVFTGYVVGRPSREGDGTLQVGCLDDRVELRHKQLDRVFYELDSATAVTQAVDTEAVQLDSRIPLTGDTPGDWSGDVSDLTNFTDGEKAGTAAEKVWEFGTDLQYIGMEADTDGTFYAENTSLPSDTVGNGQLRKLDIRYALDSSDGEVDATFELYAGGNDYLWDLPTTDGMETVTLQAADATPTGSLATGPAARVEYVIDGPLKEPFGLLLDGVETYPFEMIASNGDISTGSFTNTGRTITRDTTDSALEFIQSLATEDGRDIIVNSSQTLTYEADAGTRQPDYDIIQGESPVIGVEFDRDAEQIVNQVQVNGDGVQAVVKDSASIEFYGVNPRTDAVTDESLQTRSECVDRGTGILSDKAWADEVVTFEVADSDYRQLRAGDTLQVNWSNQDFRETCAVRGMDIKESRIVELDLGVVF